MDEAPRFQVTLATNRSRSRVISWAPVVEAPTPAAARREAEEIAGSDYLVVAVHRLPRGEQ